MPVGAEIRLGSIGAYLAPGGPGAVVVLHEWTGVVPHIRDVTDRVAAAGFTGVALDLYDGETAGMDDDAEAARLQGRIMKDPEAAVGRIAGAIDELRQSGHAKVATLGWCTGASLSLLTAASYSIDAAVGYYGIFEALAERPIAVPTLVHLAEHEEYYPSADRFRAWFGDMDNVAIHVYPGTRHAFFNDTVLTHYDPEAASLSWDRTISFLRQHL